eukprot:m.579663 g.579663  ORF g.579663 m.579663 type:complete len:53 (+) comp22315_c0_seq1:99-257(+)
MAGNVASTGKTFDNVSTLGRRNTVLACFGLYIGVYAAVKIMKGGKTEAPAAK